ncbi:unnamed protein product [Parnassius apollo]|uniref:(apollo) hypothetical protein n=1 Tax=Parnassius apollo TaxID=110799 RepID=A0A8S3X058_PARAO|nr:unnamed protein product [Parnassius apollo]
MKAIHNLGLFKCFFKYIFIFNIHQKERLNFKMPMFIKLFFLTMCIAIVNSKPRNDFEKTVSRVEVNIYPVNKLLTKSVLYSTYSRYNPDDLFNAFERIEHNNRLFTTMFHLLRNIRNNLPSLNVSSQNIFLPYPLLVSYPVLRILVNPKNRSPTFYATTQLSTTNSPQETTIVQDFEDDDDSYRPITLLDTKSKTFVAGMLGTRVRTMPEVEHGSVQAGLPTDVNLNEQAKD